VTKTQPAAEITSLAAQLSGWSPGSIELVDPLDPGPAQSLNDLLADGPAPYRGGPVDPLYHWVYFHTWPPRSSLAPDGHPRTGEFMPPLRDRRRMFAGGRCTFHSPLYFSEPAAAASSLANRKFKRGRSGEMLFVTVRTTIVQNRRLCVTDEQDLVYRSGPPQPVPGPAPTLEPRHTKPAAATGALSRRLRIAFDPVMLFRFSALTANSHRIHYDQAYARGVEGYPGLLVQGPLLVLTMAGVLRQADQPELARLSYRLHQPVFADETVDVAVIDSVASTTSDGMARAPAEGPDAPARVAIIDPTGEPRASATAEFRRASGKP
jgi:hydroxyacyl-ACP dehydratase HTD2-like protein with hotdog domain